MFTRSFLCAIAVAGLALAAAPAQDLTVDEIIKKNEDALGGAEALAKVQTLKMTMKMVVGGGQVEAPMTVWAKRPNLVRSETTIQGKTVVSAFDGTTGWMINPLVGSTEPQKMDEKTLSNLAMSNVNGITGSLAGFKTAGATVELAGKEDVEGSPAFKLKVIMKAGMTITVFLDAATFLTIKSVAKVTTMGQEMEIETYPSGYRRVSGILFPHSSEGKVGGRSMIQVNYEKIEINEPVDDALFKMPAAEKPVEKK